MTEKPKTLIDTLAGQLSYKSYLAIYAKCERGYFRPWQTATVGDINLPNGGLPSDFYLFCANVEAMDDRNRLSIKGKQALREWAERKIDSINNDW
jgi:hypothetical protein